MKISYKNWRPNAESITTVWQANAIIDDYAEQGYTLTLRQLYYQFVSRGLIPNTERSYNNLGSLITKARMAGFVSWDAIEDRNRTHKTFWFDEDIINPIEELPQNIRFDRWGRQPFYVEVWVEKEALGNVVERACNQFYVPHMSCKGYLSASEAWRAGRRFQQKHESGQRCVLIHLGDHDPSGLDMTRDNRDRLDIFTEVAGSVEVKRIALNMDQVEQYSPPPNPAKITDSRAKEYMRKFGGISWELDALEPSVIENLIVREIEYLIDWNKWNSVMAEEKEQKQILRNVYDKWDEIEHIVRGEHK